jgi:cobalt-zinc-cadmium efflux system membrane fusion protein
LRVGLVFETSLLDERSSTMNVFEKSIAATGIAGLITVFAGCGKDSSPEPTSKTGTAAVSDSSQHDGDKHASSTHDHSGWWCAEHGVPEEECGQCNAKVAAAFQKKGDWCKEHDRPDSQCFICHPEYEAAFAAKYEAKFGKKPPKPQVN